MSSQLSGTQSQQPPPESSPISNDPSQLSNTTSSSHTDQSPQVKLPLDMPELKTWFGTDNENLVSKKEEPLTPGSARDRRFRRDAEDAEASRPSFRSTPQPSQMGNFKHQSLRANDRDRDRDREGDKERERDIRDKEGQERLRHLSDKYDRDRMLPLSSARNKERDAAPHLSSNNSSRAQQSTATTTATRRGETRETSKKKVGEVSEDWRRGAESSRLNRDDKVENGKRERPERARSRVRDASRTKRETSPTRRDRDRVRDDHRRDTDDIEDDGRRWKDDGKRDERLAARRERERAKDRDRDGDDRRWATAGDDGRHKRSTGRERRGVDGDDTKDKEDRREKEKEPAWMDNYIPSESSLGILGQGELDGIQAWKKGLKEKETKEKEASIAIAAHAVPDGGAPSPAGDRQPMDEIQMFRMMMEKEKDKKRLEESGIVASSDVLAVLSRDDKSARQRPSNGVEGGGLNGSAITSLQQETPQAEVLSDMSLAKSSFKDNGIIAVGKQLGLESLQEPAIPLAKGLVDLQPNNTKAANEIGPAAIFPPSGSRVLAMKNKHGPVNATFGNLPNVNGGLQSIDYDQAHGFGKNERLANFSPFNDTNRLSHGFDQPRDPAILVSQSNTFHSQLDSLPGPISHPSPETNFSGSIGKGSRLAKIFEGRELPASKPLQSSGHIPSLNHRQEQQVPFSGGTQNSVESLVAMLNISSQRSNVSHTGPNSMVTNHGPFNTQGLALPPHQQQQLFQQQQQHNRLEQLYDSRGDDRFVPDGMVPGLRPLPPSQPRGRNDISHFNDPIEDAMQYNLQRIAQQHQSRNIDPLFASSNGPIFNAQGNRHGGGPPLQSHQQPHYRGGSSPGLNQGLNGPQQQRLPPGLANLGARPHHDPSQFMNPPQPALHGNGAMPPQQLALNNFNVANNIGFNGLHHGRGSNNHVAGTQQLPIGNLAHPNMDPRLVNQSHILNIGGNRPNGAFPPQHGPNNPSQLGMRPQQHPPHLPAHMLPQMPPHHMQGPTDSHNLMALLMGGVTQRE